MDVIEFYLDAVLIPSLNTLGIQSFPGVIEAVVADIRIRLHSFLLHWKDVEMRNTFLLIGKEEGTFYEPRSSSLDIRAMIVVTIRNSLLEDLGIPGASLIPAACEKKPMEESDVRTITEAAIQYWQTIDLSGLTLPFDTMWLIFVGGL